MSDRLTTAISLGLTNVILKEEIEFVESIYEDIGYVIGASGDNDLIEFFCDYSDYLTGHIIIKNENEANLVIETANTIIDDVSTIFEASSSKGFKIGKNYARDTGRLMYQARRGVSKKLQGTDKVPRALSAVLRAPMRIGGALRRGIMKGLGKKRGEKFADWRMAKAKKVMKKTGKRMVSDAKKAGDAVESQINPKTSKIKQILSAAKGSYHTTRNSFSGLKAAGARSSYEDWKKAKAGKQRFAK